ncbi:hypothetical protein PTMSG1_09994 [Pyrenophora teres f. maculata]|nr:hypothetical protein PTMSG1_09994 [Pyrenophora teres f. maculata]
MLNMRALTVLAVAASAAAEVGHLSQPFEPVTTGEVAPQICAKLPTLCTHAVMLEGHETTLTYLCPETEGPSTVTVTETATTTATATVTADPNVSAPPFLTPPATSDEPTTTVTLQSTHQVTVTRTATRISTSPLYVSVTSDEPTTTVTLQSTSQVTRTETITRIATSSFESSSLTPASITWSFTAVLPNSSTLSSVSLTPVLTAWSSTTVPPYNVFPTPVSSTADLLSANSTANSSSTSYVFLYHVKNTSNTPHSDYDSGYNKPSAKQVEHAKSNGTLTANETFTATATPVLPTESSNGIAGDGRVSFAALFLSLMAAAFVV